MASHKLKPLPVYYAFKVKHFSIEEASMLLTVRVAVYASLTVDVRYLWILLWQSFFFFIVLRQILFSSIYVS